ncbi:MAG: cell division protein ZapB [Candidatus Micrarchaeota archaeon]
MPSLTPQGTDATGAAPATARGSATTETGHPPQVDGFKIKGKLTKGKLKDLSTILRSVSSLELAPEKDALNVIYVESRDINKDPYLFSILKIKEDEVEVLYTIPPEIGPKKRRVDVIRYILNIFSLIAPSYDIDSKTLYQLIENAIKELAGSVTMDYNKLYTAYDSLRKEVGDLKKKISRLTDQNQALTSQNYELKASNDELSLRLQQLEGLSDEALKAKLQEWISEHGGSINIVEFSKLHHVAEAKVEEMLNRLVSEGYLEVVR